MVRKIFIFLILICFLAISLYGDNADINYVENLVKEKTNKAIALITDTKLSEKEKKKRIFEEISPLFDFTIMSKLTLGKKYWPKLSKQQRKEFIELFKKRIKMVYLDRVTISGKLTVKYKTPVVKNKKIIYMPTVFTTNGKDYSVLFKLWKSPDSWKVYDVEVEGVSIIRTYRSQFYDILSNGTINDLLNKLKNVTGSK